MIRYPISEAQLNRKIRSEDAGWLDEAKLRLDAFRTAGKYDEDLSLSDSSGRNKKASPIWSKVKPVYMRIQSEKCAYCERRLSSEEWGKVEHDLEHYRPKKKAKPWKPPTVLRRERIVVTQPQHGADDPGYHLLSYHLMNYCTSCKTCNSGLKRNEFPIEGPRECTGDNPRLMASEKALLLYPIGDIDVDPETLIEFYGLSPRAIRQSGFERRRALVNIEFFQLNNPKRKELFRERAHMIVTVYSFLQNRNSTGDVWDRLVQTHMSPHSPHTSCVRSFVRLYHSNRQEADDLFAKIAAYYNSISK